MLRRTSEGKSLLEQIESEALDGDVVKALRLCITLGGRSESVEIREWAARELRGYASDDEIPDYRRIRAPLCVDGVTGNAFAGVWKATGQMISAYQLPEFARDDISEDLELLHSIPELQDMARDAERDRDPIRLVPAGAAELIAYMNASGSYSIRIDQFYWQVAPTTIKSVLERVCTDIVDLIGEMRSGMTMDQEWPSPDLASQAFNVAVTGTGNRVVVKNVRQSDYDASTDETPTHKNLRAAFWIAGIVGAIIGVATVALQVFG